MSQTIVKSRLAVLAVLVGALGVGGPGALRAQTRTIRDVPAGDVTGLELAIEGTLRVQPGGRLRWFVTAYEIVRGRDLRPARDTSLRALASFHRAAPVAEAVTDADGRAALAFDVPDDLEGAFELAVEARSPRRVTRRFDVSVALEPRFRTELFLDRSSWRLGEPLRAWGRVLDVTTGRPAPRHRVRVRAGVAGGAQLGRELDLRTDEAGVFHADLGALTAQPATAVVVAEAEGAAQVTRGNLAIVRPDVPALVVHAAPERAVVAPGSTIQVDVVVRTADGRPVPRATLSGLSIPEPRSRDQGKERAVPPVLTDERGRARVPWRVVSTAPIADVTGQIVAVREGLGSGSGTARVRAARVPVVVTWAVEGGTLIPGLPGRVFLRASGADGRPLAGAAARLDGGLLAATPATTDAEGVAILEVTPPERDRTAAPRPAPTGEGAGEEADGPLPGCSGATVAAVTVRLGAHAEELCLPVDPDATVRVRTAPTVESGRPLDVHLERRRAVAGAPVEVTLLVTDEGRTIPVAQAVVPGETRRVSIGVPAETVGLIWVRARPLIGAARQEVRGGGTLVWAAPRHRPGLRVSAAAGGTVQVDLAGAAAARESAFVVALPIAAGEALAAALARAPGQRPGRGALGAGLAGWLAAHTPVDEAVAAVLRDGAPLPLPILADPVAAGRLRDPWRSRARYVRGHLGRLLRAVERAVAARIPDGLADVGEAGAGGWRFNRELMTIVALGLDPEAIAGLDGSPLSLEALQALDPAFTYDNVARRITRERLLRLLVSLDRFVEAHGLDYEWARRGQPDRWLTGLLDWADPERGEPARRADLFDAWGRPFAVRAARGGRARFRFLEPIVGYEVVSAGPNGRFGDGDDLFDPFQRVLASGSAYADAVGEDVLLARLRGVELGRATVAALAEVFEIEAGEGDDGEVARPEPSWDSAPTVVEDPAGALAVRLVGRPVAGAGVFRTLEAPGARIALALPAEPHRYVVVAGSYGADGQAAFGAARLDAGVPLLVDAPLPGRLRPGESVRIPVRLTYLGGRQTLELRVASSGAVRARVAGDAPAPRFTLEAGDARTVELDLTADAAGAARVELSVRTADGRALVEARHVVRVVWDGALRVQHAGGWIEGRGEARLDPPAGARPLGATLVLAGPRDLLRDPGLEGAAGARPALLAWAHALRGERLPDARRDALAGWPGPGATPSALESACAAVAWSAASEARPDDPAIEASLGRALGALRSAPPASLRDRAAVLVALAAGASGLAPRDDGIDPILALVGALREESWDAVARPHGQPTEMARLAAGLLLSDRRDEAGRELFERARAALVPGDHGGRVLPGDGGQAVDGWIGTAALALAARQLGEDALAVDLGRGLASRLYLGMGADGEAAFWLLAASVYGVFGLDGPREVQVRVGDRSQRVTLRDGVAVLPLPASGARVVVESARPVLARLEARYVRPVAATADAALAARLEGQVGYVGDTAALELVIASTSKATPIARPVVELHLPSVGDLPEEARATLARTPGVLAVEPADALGLVRVHLAPLEPRAERRLPLPLRWTGGGVVRGLSVAVFDAERPWLLSTLPARELVVRPRPQETWR